MTWSISIHRLTILTNHSSTSSFLKADHATSLVTQLKAFSKSTIAKCKFFFFAKYFSCYCLKIKMAFVVPQPGIKVNCISSMPTFCYINTTQELFELSSQSDLFISVPCSFFFLNNCLSSYDSLKCKVPFCWYNSYYNSIY